MDATSIKIFLSENSQLIWFYLPLGIIGLWRWGVWSIRKIAALFYRMPRNSYVSTLSIVTPVYNEDPDIFRQALYSWRQNNPDEIIAVIDYVDKKSIAVFKNFQKEFYNAKLIITKKQGKRSALADGIVASKSDIVALVDSDTVWSSDIKTYLLGPFSDPKVGGVVTRQDVLHPDTLARKIFKIHLDNRYLNEFPFLAAVSDALICLSGRTAVYRREAIISELNNLVKEKFMGKYVISGDDKTLTHLVQAKGWKTRFLRDVKVFTPGMAKLSSLIKQQLRWTRNGLRSDIKVIFSFWIWKNHKWLGFYMIDKFIQPVTLLLSPIFFLISIVSGFFPAALVLVAWWLISRAIKIYPHFKERPQDIFILPVYIPLTFIMAVIKIYALITIGEQGWLTRWDKERLVRLGLLKRIMSYGATGMVVFLLFFGIFNYKNEILMAERAEKQRQKSVSILTLDKPRPSDSELENKKIELIKARQDDSFGYYEVKTGDTLSGLRKKFNLAGQGRILDAETRVPVGNFTIFQTGQKLVIPVAELRNPIEKSILSPNPTVKPSRINYDQQNNTIFVKEAGSVTTLAKINQSLPPFRRKLLEQVSPGEWVLRANLYIGKNVTLILDGDEVKELKMKSDDNFVWLRSEAGNILISKTKVISWNENDNTPDYDYSDGRSYITARNSGRMDIINSDLSYLGYSGFPNRGGPFGGSYGVSWKINNNGFRERLLTGVVLNSKFHNNYFGLYTFGATGMLIRGNEFYENIQYGLDPHDDSNNFLIENNRAYRNGNHGIILSRRCFDNVISGNISIDNRLHGIMLDRGSNNNLVEGNTVYGNVDGLAIYDSHNNLVLENEVRHNMRGIRINAGSKDNYLEKNVIFSNSRGLYIYDQSQRNISLENEVRGNEIGITIKNASDNIFLNNFKENSNKKDGRVTVDSYENIIQ